MHPPKGGFVVVDAWRVDRWTPPQARYVGREVRFFFFSANSLKNRYTHEKQSVVRGKKQQYMRCRCHSLVSACILLICAMVAQSVQGFPDPVSVSFLLVGVTSVIHHSRLDEWWKRDVWRLLDYAAIAAFVTCAIIRFGIRADFLLLSAVASVITVAIWRGDVKYDDIPSAHALMHILTAIVVMAAVLVR